jgi:LPXTG-site transpeptidase (sortase) family protein
MKKRSVLYHISNICIVVSFLGFSVTIYPIINAYIFPAKEVTINELKKKKGYYIDIPKIHAQSAIKINIDPWNEVEYKKALTEGVAHAKDTALPGERGTAFLFAHSSGAPWELTQTNTLFLRLGELQINDIITVTHNGNSISYSVYEKKEVWPDEVNYLQDQTTKEVLDRKLILQTCTPIGTSLKRLLVFAKQK